LSDERPAGETIVVTGGSGLLGRTLASLATPTRAIVALGRDALDIADSDAIARTLDIHAPEVVVNCAAMTDVDGCERDPEAARVANVDGPRRLAVACAHARVRLVHVSTDFVFDGRKREPYTQEDTPRPLSVYGRTKREGEEEVLDALPRAIVARTSWVFGPGGKNFASRLFEFAAKTRTLRGIVDSRSVPTYAPDLAARLLELVDCGAKGIFHVTGSGDATWFDVARAELDFAGRNDVELLPTTVAELGLPAPRPPYSVMRCLETPRLDLAPLRHWRDALAEFVPLVASRA
jgi:dTDP-4-dehydrorhamnose reductase/4-ketoreductase